MQLKLKLFSLIVVLSTTINAAPPPGIPLEVAFNTASEHLGGAALEDDISLLDGSSFMSEPLSTPVEDRYDIAYLELRSALSRLNTFENVENHPDVAEKLQRFRAAETARNLHRHLIRIDAARAKRGETSRNLHMELFNLGTLNGEPSREMIFTLATEYPNVKKALVEDYVASNELHRAEAGLPALTPVEDLFDMSYLELRLALFKVSVPLKEPITESLLSETLGKYPDLTEKVERYRAAKTAQDKERAAAARLSF